MKQISLTLALIITLTTVCVAQDSSLQQYAGVYKFPNGSAISEVTVAIENGILTMNSAAGSSNLERTGVDSFYISSFEGTAVFSRNADKKIKGVYIEARGVRLDGLKDQPQGNIAFYKRQVPDDFINPLSRF